MAKHREALDRRWAQSIADGIRYGRQTGEFPSDDHDPDDLAMQFGSLMDGLAIQVLLNDTVLTPKRMHAISLDVAKRLIGFDGEL